MPETTVYEPIKGIGSQNLLVLVDGGAPGLVIGHTLWGPPTRVSLTRPRLADLRRLVIRFAGEIADGVDSQIRAGIVQAIDGWVVDVRVDRSPVPHLMLTFLTPRGRPEDSVRIDLAGMTALILDLKRAINDTTTEGTPDMPAFVDEDAQRPELSELVIDPETGLPYLPKDWCWVIERDGLSSVKISAARHSEYRPRPAQWESVAYTYTANLTDEGIVHAAEIVVKQIIRSDNAEAKHGARLRELIGTYPSKRLGGGSNA